MCPPMFHKLLYKLLTALCVVSDCAPPNQKVFPTPLCYSNVLDPFIFLCGKSGFQQLYKAITSPYKDITYRPITKIKYKLIPFLSAKIHSTDTVANKIHFTISYSTSTGTSKCLYLFLQQYKAQPNKMAIICSSFNALSTDTGCIKWSLLSMRTV